MIELLGSIGWGLFACGAITHIWHHDRLRQLLGLHINSERLPALLLTTLEAALAVLLPLAALTRHSLLPWLAGAAFVLAAGFMVWIARLLLTGSDLPCACSFSSAPTTWWSFARSLCVGLVGLLGLAATDAGSLLDDTGLLIGTFAAGWAVASALFVLPEALSWPAASKALLARVEAYDVSQGAT